MFRILVIFKREYFEWVRDKWLGLGGKREVVSKILKSMPRIYGNLEHFFLKLARGWRLEEAFINGNFERYLT